jgi:hypothetical protein
MYIIPCIFLLHLHFFINSESSCSSDPLVEIFHVSGSHHILEDLPYTMVGSSLYISFDSTNVSQVHGCFKYEPWEDFQDNEALRSMSMVMPYPCSFGLSYGVNKFTNINILSPRTPHTCLMHGSHLLCYFPLNPLH